MKYSKDFFYQIAGHAFRLSFSQAAFAVEGLNNYDLFRVEACTEENVARCLFHLSVVGALPMDDAPELIDNFADDIADIAVSRFASIAQTARGEKPIKQPMNHFTVEEKSVNGGYLFCIAPPNGKTCATMICNSTFTEAQVALGGDTGHHFFGLNNCLMMMYAFAAAPHRTLLTHASVVMYEGLGYVFQGRSGTGKSTHSRMWLEAIDGTKLLNDDNPILRVESDGSVRVYGSPWSGKTQCYRNESVPLGAIVRIKQAPLNIIRRNSPTQAFASLKPTCSTMPWDKAIHDGTCDTVSRIVEKISIFTLECLPDHDAARVCCEAVAK